MRLSHSAKNTYLQCGEKWRLHYQEKLRSPKLASALFFGSALDEAFSRLLLDKKPIKTEGELSQLDKTAEEVFYQNMVQVESNGQMVELAKSPFADYYTSDFTQELLTDEAVRKLSEYAPDVAGSEETAKRSFLSFMEECKAQLKAKKKLTQEDVMLYNYATWLTLVEKGLLMIRAYREQVMPQIFEVYSIQERIDLPNADGDSISGLIDFTASFVDDPGTMYICDNKTSSKPYKASETAESDQLATYCEFKGTDKAAYVVAIKGIYKTGAMFRTQILRDTIPEAKFAQTFAQFENVLYSISTGRFEKNFKSCFDFGRMCPFYALCKHGNADGLIDLKEKESEQV